MHGNVSAMTVMKKFSTGKPGSVLAIGELGAVAAIAGLYVWH